MQYLGIPATLNFLSNSVHMYIQRRDCCANCTEGKEPAFLLPYSQINNLQLLKNAKEVIWSQCNGLCLVFCARYSICQHKPNMYISLHPLHLPQTVFYMEYSDYFWAVLRSRNYFFSAPAPTLTVISAPAPAPAPATAIYWRLKLFLNTIVLVLY